MTKYLVLQATDEEAATWAYVGPDTVEATSADQAIREVAARRVLSSDTVQFVAVPARSWKPRTVKVEQTTKVDFA